MKRLISIIILGAILASQSLVSCEKKESPNQGDQTIVETNVSDTTDTESAVTNNASVAEEYLNSLPVQSFEGKSVNFLVASDTLWVTKLLREI